MNDEQFFLANAYLDGELTAEERAIADADPVVMAAVEELRALQDQVRAVEPPSPAVREAAISSAMAQFGAAAPPAAAQPDDRHHRRSDAAVPLRPRPSYARYLAVAAGVLGVGLLGVAIANVGTGGDDDSADDAALEPAADEPAADERTAATFTIEGGTVEGGAVEEGTADMATEMAADEPAEEPAMEPAEAPAEEPAEEPASEPIGDPPVLVPGQVLTTPEELGAFGTELLEQERAGTLPPTPNHACPIDGVLGRADYLAEGTETSVLVAVDEPAAVVLGFDEETCELLVEGPLYLP